MKHWLMALLMLSMSAAYAGSDSEEEKSPAEKKAIRKPVLEEGQLPWRPQLMGPQRNVLAHQHSASQDPDQTIQDLMARISELEISNTALKTKNKKLKENNKTFITTAQILNTNVQSLMVENRDLKENNRVLDTTIQNATITIQGLNIRTNELELYNQDLNNEIARLNADLDDIHQELIHRNQANQALGTQVANLESEKVNLESARISLKDEKSALSAEIVQLKEANQTLGMKATDLESLSTTLSAEFSQLKKCLPSLAEYAHSLLRSRYESYPRYHWHTEEVRELISKGYKAILLRKLPDNSVQQNSAEEFYDSIGFSARDCSLRCSLPCLEHFVIEDQAKAIRRLIWGKRDEGWLQAYQDLYNQGYPVNQETRWVRLESKYKAYKACELEKVIELISQGYLYISLSKLPDNFAQQSPAERKDFRRNLISVLQAAEPYVVEHQAKMLRRLVEVDVIDEQVDDWIQAHQDLYNRGDLDDKGTQWVKLVYKYTMHDTEWVMELVDKGYNEIWLEKLPDNFAQQSPAKRNAFCQDVISFLQTTQSYIVEDQAKVIHGLIKFDVMSEHHLNDWIQAYQDLYQQGGYTNSLGGQMIRLYYQDKWYRQKIQNKI